MQAMGGIMGVTGPIGGPPVKVGIPITDFFTALYAAIGIIIALWERKASGKGQYLDFSMFESTLSLLSFIGAFYLYEGKIPQAFGSGNPVRVPTANYQTKDRRYIHLVPNDRQWKEFCHTLGLEEMADNPDYDSNAKRIGHREKIDQRIQEKIFEKDLDQWVEIFNEKGFPAGPIYTTDEVFKDPQVIAREILAQMDHPRHGKIKTIKLPFSFCEFKSGIKGPAPALGEHTRQILFKILGYGDKEIDQLFADKVIR